MTIISINLLKNQFKYKLFNHFKQIHVKLYYYEKHIFTFEFS